MGSVLVSSQLSANSQFSEKTEIFPLLFSNSLTRGMCLHIPDSVWMKGEKRKQPYVLSEKTFLVLDVLNRHKTLV